MCASLRFQQDGDLMILGDRFPSRTHRRAAVAVLALCFIGGARAGAQTAAPKDPPEPQAGKPPAKLMARPSGRLLRTSVDEKTMKSLISELVGCGSRLTIGPW